MSPRLARIAAPILPPELEQQFGEWRWLVGDDAEVLCMTLMGDRIFVGREGAICLLDTMEATIQVVAPTLEHLELLLDSPDERDALLLEGLALAVLAGQRLPAGHCVGYRVPPVLGGATDKSNLEVARAASYQAWMGRLHEALLQVPADRKVLGVDVTESGGVSVRWE